MREQQMKGFLIAAKRRLALMDLATSRDPIHLHIHTIIEDMTDELALSITLQAPTLDMEDETLP